ncbi:hypothetical protein ACFLWM_00740 [Chloroflexota bacterium]
MEGSEERNLREDILAQYRPFIDELSRSLKEKGEAATLQELITSGENRALRDIHRLLLTQFYDFKNTSPEGLARIASGAALYVVIAFSSWKTIKRGFVPPDLGTDVPPSLLKALLRQPNPYRAFNQAMFSSQLFDLCMTEIEGRGLKHPELMAELDFAYSQSNKRAKHEALKYLRSLSFERRAYEAGWYELEFLALLESSIDEAFKNYIKEQKSPDEYTDFDEYIKQGRLISEAVRDLQNGYPEFEKDCLSYGLKAIEATENLREAIIKDFETECDVLLKGIAGRLFGFSEKPDFELDILGNESIKKMEHIIKIDGIAWNWKDSMLGLGFSESDKEEESRITAEEGLFKGMGTWVNKDMETLISAGLTEHLKRSFRKAIEYRLTDEYRKVKRVERHDGAGQLKIQREVPYAMFGESTDEDRDDVQRIEAIDARRRLKEEEFKDELDTERDIFYASLPKVKLTGRERLVIDLTRENRKDAEIALALQEKYGRKVKEENVRQLRHRAVKKIRQYIQS